MVLGVEDRGRREKSDGWSSNAVAWKLHCALFLRLALRINPANLASAISFYLLCIKVPKRDEMILPIMEDYINP